MTKRLSSDAGTGRLEPDDQAERACGEPPPAELILAVRQFNRGEYFEQHETLELLWRREPRRIRRLYQGVLLVGAGLHHLRRGNYHGALALMQRGMRRLAPFSPQCQGVDVADLIARTTVACDLVARLGPGRLGQVDWARMPRVRWAAEPAGGVGS